MQNAARTIRLTLGAIANAPIAALVMSAATSYGVDPSLALAVAQRESGLDPNAVSPKGAKGVMQLMPQTAADLGVTDIFNPAENISAGVRYLAQLLSKYAGDAVKALAAYNWGPGNVSGAIAQAGNNWLSLAPAETRNYVQAITGVTPQSNLSPITIDATTGEPIEDTAIVPSDQPAEIASLLPAGMTPGKILLLTGVAIGVFLLSEIVTDR